MGTRMDDDIVDVDDDVLDLVEDLFHKALKRSRTTQKSHGRGDPFELSDPLDREGGGVAVRFIDGHLPEAGGEINGREDGGVGSSNVTDALIDLLHGILVGVGFGIETSEVLNNSESLARFLGHTEDGRVVRRLGTSDNPQPEPFL